MDDQNEINELEQDFRQWWQRPVVSISLGVVCVAAAVWLMVAFEVFDWAGDQIRSFRGEMVVGQRILDEDIRAYSPMGELHMDYMTTYFDTVIRSDDPGNDPAVDAALEAAIEFSGDAELERLLGEFHDQLQSKKPELAAVEDAWNQRLQQLDEPYALVARTTERQGEKLYWSETYRIHTVVETELDGQRHSVDWRYRLDNFRYAAESPFYQRDRDESSVRTDRGWITIWNQLVPVILSEEDLAEFDHVDEQPDAFGWKEELRDEIEMLLGERHFKALLRGGVHRHRLESIAQDVAVRGRDCGHRFRLVRVPWFGYEPSDLETFDEVADIDRYDECPRITRQEATELRRESSKLQTDSGYHEAMPRLLAAFLTHKTIMAAAHRHRMISIDEPPCSDCDGWSDDEAAEIGGYLTATTEGPYPRLGLFRLCFGHRYGSSQSYRGWLELLRDHGFECREQMPTDLLERLAEAEEEHFSPIEHVDFVGMPPEEAPIYWRD